jgi:hypothetical protein
MLRPGSSRETHWDKYTVDLSASANDTRSGSVKKDTDNSPLDINTEPPTSLRRFEHASPAGKGTGVARALIETNRSKAMRRTPTLRAKAADLPEASTTTAASTGGRRPNSNRQPFRVFDMDEIRA